MWAICLCYLHVRASCAISLPVTWTISCKSHKSNYILITEWRLLFSEKGIWAINGKKCWMWVSFGNHHLQSLKGCAISLTPFNQVHFFHVAHSTTNQLCWKIPTFLLYMHYIQHQFKLFKQVRQIKLYLH